MRTGIPFISYICIFNPTGRVKVLLERLHISNLFSFEMLMILAFQYTLIAFAHTSCVVTAFWFVGTSKSLLQKHLAAYDDLHPGFEIVHQYQSIWISSPATNKAVPVI